MTKFSELFIIFCTTLSGRAPHVGRHFLPHIEQMVSKLLGSLIYLLPVTNCSSSPTTSSSGSYLPVWTIPCPTMMSLEIHDECKTGRTINSLIIILFSHPHDRSLAIVTKPSSNKLLFLNQPRFEKQWKKPQHVYVNVEGNVDGIETCQIWCHHRLYLCLLFLALNILCSSLTYA